MRKLAAILALTALVMSGCEDLLSIVGETYTVTYYANGATSGETPSPQDFEPGSQVTVANRQTLARSGYEFDGWNTLADGSGTKRTVGETFTMPKNNVSLYAQWKATNAAQRTVTFNANGGTGTAMSPLTLAEGASATLPACAFTRANYSFQGWATSASGSVAYANQATLTMGTANIVLYAVWQAIPPSTPTHTVTFNANGGTGTAMSPLTLAEGASATLPACAFTRANYSFQGWATSASGSVAYANQATLTMGTANIVLYAVWIADSTDVDVIIDGQQSTTVDVIVGGAP